MKFIVCRIVGVYDELLFRGIMSHRSRTHKRDGSNFWTLKGLNGLITCTSHGMTYRFIGRISAGGFRRMSAQSSSSYNKQHLRRPQTPIR